MNRLRVGVVGAGHLGRIHARLLGGQPEVQLVGVADPAEAARQRAAQECHTTAYPDHRALLGHIDAAVVAAPTPLHHAVGLELLEHGVHVLMEKPLTRTVAEADQLVAAARRGGLVLQVGHVERYNPALAAVQPHVQSPKYIEAVRRSGFTFRSTDVGVVLDLMIHDLDLVLTLVQSELVQVEALGLSLFGRHEDIAHARLKFASGCVANLNASRASFQPQRHMQIFCERGYASIDFASGEAKLVQPAAALRSRELDVLALPAEQQEHLKNHLFDELLRLEQVSVAPANAILQEQQEFVQAVRGHAPVRVTGEAARAALDAAERILGEIDRHCWTADPLGPCGPLALPAPTLLRPPQEWTRGAGDQPDRDQRRKAG